MTGTGSLPAPVRLHAADLGETTEGRLVELTGTVASAPTKGTSGDFTVNLTDASGGTFRILCDASSKVDAATFVKGKAFRVTGIVGQRASPQGRARRLPRLPPRLEGRRRGSAVPPGIRRWFGRIGRLHRDGARLCR